MIESENWDVIKHKDLNGLSQSVYLLIDYFLGKDYQDFRDYYTAFIKNKQGRTIKIGTFDELTKEAVDRADRHLKYKQKEIWKEKARQKSRFRKDNFYYVNVYDVCNNLAPTDLGLYKDIHPFTEKDIAALIPGIYSYLTADISEDEIHVVGRVKFLLLSHSSLKEIAHITHLDYRVLVKVKNGIAENLYHDSLKNKSVESIKDLSRKTISTLSNLCLQLLAEERQ